MEYDQEVQALIERVNQFQCMELPGQPMGMHMGTAYLVSDLLKRIKADAEVIATYNKHYKPPA